jgi:hypothetical protein
VEDSRSAGVPPFFLLLYDICLAVILLAAAASAFTGRRLGLGHLAVAALVLLDAVLLAVFVFGEDSYRDNGISRWNAYRSGWDALGPMFVVSMVVLIGCSVLLTVATLRDRGRHFAVAGTVVAIAAVFLVVPTVIGFSNN